MIRIFIAEDSQENIETLKYLLQSSGVQFEISAIAKTLEEAYDKLKSHPCDIAFLDIQFKKGTIFSVLDSLNNEDVLLPSIVFITAHGSFEYALKAIKYACLDFINKPIHSERLMDTLRNIEEQKRSAEEQKNQINLLLNLIEGDLNQPKTVGVARIKNKIEYVALEDLLYIKADGSTSLFHTLKTSFQSIRHLGYYIELFQDTGFMVQISRFYIVNKNHIVSYNPKTRLIQLADGTELLASYRANKNLKRLLKNKESSSLLSKIGKLKDLILGE